MQTAFRPVLVEGEIMAKTYLIEHTGGEFIRIRPAERRKKETSVVVL